MLSNAIGSSFTICDNNEDAFGVVQNCAWVLDGSTGLSGRRLVADCTDSDAAWYAKRFSDYLRKALHDPAQTLTQIFAEGVREVWQEFESLANDRILQDDVPCTLGTAVRVSENTFEFINIGDCPLLVRFRDGSVLQYRDDSLPNLDAESLKFAVSLAKKHNLSLRECDELLKPRLKEVRRLAGQENGYVALSNRPECISRAPHGSFPLNSVLDFCILSDGFEQFYSLFQLCTKEEFMDLAATREHSELFEILKQAQENDPTRNNFPRFKLSDDATLIYCKIPN